MASVKASVYVPPVQETESVFTDVPKINDSINVENIIYLLMFITIFMFFKKLILFVYRKCGLSSSVKYE
jgi:hypothetical protein